MTTQDWEENVRVIPKWEPLDTGLTAPTDDHTEDAREIAQKAILQSLHPSAKLSEARKARAAAIAKAVGHIEMAQHELEQAIDWVGVYHSGRDFSLVKNALSATVNQIRFDADSEQGRR